MIKSRIDKIIEERNHNAHKRIRTNSNESKLQNETKEAVNVIQNNLYNTILHTNEKYQRTGSSTYIIRDQTDEIENYHQRQIQNIRSNPWRNLPIKVKLQCVEEYLNEHQLIDPETNEPVDNIKLRKSLLNKLIVKYSTKLQKIIKIEIPVYN